MFVESRSLVWDLGRSMCQTFFRGRWGPQVLHDVCDGRGRCVSLCVGLWSVCPICIVAVRCRWGQHGPKTVVINWIVKLPVRPSNKRPYRDSHFSFIPCIQNWSEINHMNLHLGVCLNLFVRLFWMGLHSPPPSILLYIVGPEYSRPAVLNLLLQFPHFGHYQTIISPLPQPNIP